MLQTWMRLALVATLLPMVALLGWVLPSLVARLRQGPRSLGLAFAATVLACGAYLFAWPHDDVFAGLDVAPYRTLAHGLGQVRGLHETDRVLAQVPETLRSAFLFKTKMRPTRDLSFELADLRGVATRPFFGPLLPMAAGALAPRLSPDRFVPLLASLWVGLVLAAGCSAGGGWGLMATVALLVGTAWPAWFLRGFFPEAVGALLVSAVLGAACTRRLGRAMLPIAGFALGLATSYHPTLGIVAGPVALGLLLEQGGDWRRGGALVAGGLAGVAPAWALTRWVCQPYGDWTRWRMLRQMLGSVPEHRAFVLAMGVVAVGAVVVIGVLSRPSVRRRLARVDAGATPWGWAVALAVPLALVLLLPGSVGAALREGGRSVWSGIRWGYGAWLLVASAFVLRKDRRPLERFWLAAFCGSALFAFFLKGVETPAGLWSHRRFLPVLLSLLALLAGPLSAGCARLAGTVPARRALLALALVAGGMNAVRWPTVFLTSNERGATAYVRSVAERIAGDRWVVFDYFPHAVPYMADLDHRVLGLGEKSQGRWPEVADWLGVRARDEEVWVATSWSPCRLEAGARLEPQAALEGLFPIVRTKDFFPAESGTRAVRNAFLRWVPLAEDETAPQDKLLDGSPIGLRGPWGPLRPMLFADGRRMDAVWTREGSGVIGPVPRRGGRVSFRLLASSGRGVAQTLRVSPPWGGAPWVVEVPPQATELHGTLDLPLDGKADEAVERPTGVFVCTSPTPYDPAAEGLQGYPADLGVLLRRVRIRVVESSVP